MSDGDFEDLAGRVSTEMEIDRLKAELAAAQAALRDADNHLLHADERGDHDMTWARWRALHLTAVEAAIEAKKDDPSHSPTPQ